MPEEKQEKELLTCPCCGKHTFEAPAKLDEATKQRYLTCIISGVPYTQEYLLFGGVVKVLITELPASVTDKMVRLGAMASLEQSTDRKSALIDLIGRLYRLLPLQTISIESSSDIKQFHVSAICQEVLDTALDKDSTTEQLLTLYAKLTDPASVSSISQGILDKLLNTHSQTLDLLVNSGFDEAFYQGIPHAC